MNSERNDGGIPVGGWHDRMSCGITPRQYAEAVEPFPLPESPSSGEPPERRFVIEVKWGGDTFEDAKQELISALYDIHEKSRLVSGGPSSGGWVMVRENPSMTHCEYFNQLGLYILDEARKS